NSWLTGHEAIEHQAPAFALVELQNARDGILRNERIRIEEAEHASGADRHSRVARHSTCATGTGDESNAHISDEPAHDRRGGVFARVVDDDDLESGVRKPQLISRDA